MNPKLSAVLLSIVSTFPIAASAAGLTHKQALQRATLLDPGSVRYTLEFALSESAPEFQGRATIEFKLQPGTPGDADLLLDFRGGTVSSIAMNCPSSRCHAEGAEQAIQRRKDGFIIFKISELRAGEENRLVIDYSHPYASGGNALTRAKDSADGSTYIFTNLEPYYANQVFPCFDQPDLKANFEVSVTAPKDWTVVSNAQLDRVSPLAGGLSGHRFEPTEKISTYLFALAAGPFREWKAQVSLPGGQGEESQSIPLRLLAPKSVADFVQYQEWLKITAEGLKYFAREFAQPYPYGKLDQVLVPGLSFSGMENPGAVFYNSTQFVFRGVTYAKRYVQRTKIILHEISHQWFGNLVTMKWWDDLWLNESFAMFMESLSLQAMRDLPSSDLSWMETLTESKSEAYAQDAKSTSHPVLANISDMSDADANFDDLTYDKGAAVIRQLYLQVGAKSFRNGLRDYFKKFAGSNATFQDLVQTISAHSPGQNVEEWSRAWLTTTGFNRVGVEPICRGDRLTELHVKQTVAYGSPVLRSHQMTVGLYAWDSSRAKLASHHLRMRYEGQSTRVAVRAKIPCPGLVLPNADDTDYVEVALNESRDIPFVIEHLPKLPSAIARQSLWLHLWQKVESAELAPKKFAELALRAIPHENDIYILTGLLSKLTVRSPDVDTVLRYLRGGDRDQFLQSLETIVYDGLQAAAPGSPAQMVWWISLTRLASTEKTRSIFADVLAGKQRLSGFVVTPDRRWEALGALAVFAGEKRRAEILDLLAAELKREPTGRNWIGYVELRIGDLEYRRQWLDWMLKEKVRPGFADADLMNASWYFHSFGQEEISKSLAPAFFDRLWALAKRPEAARPDPTFFRRMATQIYPRICDAEVKAMAENFLHEHGQDLPPIARKAIQQNIEQDAECLKVLAAFPSK